MTRITDEAVEAASRAAWNYRIDAAGGVPWDEARMLHGEALDPFTWQHRAALEAALPHLEGVTPAIDRAAIKAHRMTSPGTAWRDASCACGWTGIDFWDHQADALLALIGGDQ